MDNATAVQKQPFKLDIDETIKAQAEAVFAHHGFTSLAAVQSFYVYVAKHQSLPFAVDVPNATTVQAIRNFSEGAKVHEVNDFTGFCASIAED